MKLNNVFFFLMALVSTAYGQQYKDSHKFKTPESNAINGAQVGALVAGTGQVFNYYQAQTRLKLGRDLGETTVIRELEDRANFLRAINNTLMFKEIKVDSWSSGNGVATPHLHPNDEEGKRLVEQYRSNLSEIEEIEKLLKTERRFYYPFKSVSVTAAGALIGGLVGAAQDLKESSEID